MMKVAAFSKMNVTMMKFRIWHGEKCKINVILSEVEFWDKQKTEAALRKEKPKPSKIKERLTA